MNFFILTAAILLGTIFIVHFAANRVGFRLFYFPLFLSAALALAINLIVISMREVTSPLSLIKILLSVLVAAALVTIVNDVQARREKKRLIALKKDRKTIADRTKSSAAQTPEDEQVDSIESADDVETSENLEELEKPKKESFINRLFKWKSKTATPKDVAEDIENTENIENVESVVNVEDVEGKSEEVEEVEEVEVNEVDKDSEIEAKSSDNDFSRFETLDDILDYAYDMRISGKYREAVLAYEAAIERYEDDPYLPFLFIDLANVHKGQGEYDAAIDIYKKAVNMDSIKKSEDTLNSFNDNIDYLIKLKKVLRKRKMEHARFGDLTEDIFKEVDEES